MRWAQKSEHLDKRTGMHTFVLHEPESGAEHHVVFLKEELLGEGFDPKVRVAEELRAVQESHDALEAYALKHRVPVRTVDGKTRLARGAR